MPGGQKHYIFTISSLIGLEKKPPKGQGWQCSIDVWAQFYSLCSRILGEAASTGSISDTFDCTRLNLSNKTLWKITSFSSNNIT